MGAGESISVIFMFKTVIMIMIEIKTLTAWSFSFHWLLFTVWIICNYHRLGFDCENLMIAISVI